MSKPKFKIGDLVRIAVFSYAPEDIGIIVSELSWRDMVEITYPEKKRMWRVHFPSTGDIKVFAENWLVLVK